MSGNPSWVDWYKSRFAPVLAKVRDSAADESVEYRAAAEVLELISRFVMHAAYGMDLHEPVNGLLKRELPVYIHGRNMAEAVSLNSVRAGNNTAIFMEELLKPFQQADGLPGGILFTAERYENSPPWADTDSLRNKDFRYYVVIHFPD